MGVRCSNLHTKFHKHIHVHTLTLTSIHSTHHTIHTHTTQIKTKNKNMWSGTCMIFISQSESYREFSSFVAERLLSSAHYSCGVFVSTWCVCHFAKWSSLKSLLGMQLCHMCAFPFWSTNSQLKKSKCGAINEPVTRKNSRWPPNR